MIVAKRRCVLLAAWILLAAFGCGPSLDPDIPRVVYPDQIPPPPPKVTVNVPDWTIGAASVSLTIAPVSASDPLLFTGLMIPESEDENPSGALILIFQPDANGDPLIGNVRADPAHAVDEGFRYDAHLKAPADAGTYQVEVRRAGGIPETQLIATGELVVQ